MGVILFGATIPYQQVAAAVIALITAVLLFNVKKYFARPSTAQKRGIKPGEEPKYMTAREMAQKNAQIKPEPTFTGAYKPEKIAQWEVEFFELTRQMTAQIDMKMSALSALSQDAARVCQRMEILLERLENAIANSMEKVDKIEKIPINPPVRPFSPQFPPSVAEPVNRFDHFQEFPPNSALSPSFAAPPVPLEPGPEKKTLFPRLSSLMGSLEFSDNDDLATLGADLFAEDPLEPKVLDPKVYGKLKETKSFQEKPVSSPPALMDWQPTRPVQELEPQNDHTLGELLLREKHQNQAVKQQSVPKAPPTLQPTPTIESIFKPIEPRPIGVRTAPQIIPREKVGS